MATGKIQDLQPWHFDTGYSFDPQLFARYKAAVEEQGKKMPISFVVEIAILVVVYFGLGEGVGGAVGWGLCALICAMSPMLSMQMVVGKTNKEVKQYGEMLGINNVALAAARKHLRAGTVAWQPDMADAYAASVPQAYPAGGSVAPVSPRPAPAASTPPQSRPVVYASQPSLWQALNQPIPRTTGCKIWLWICSVFTFMTAMVLIASSMTGLGMIILALLAVAGYQILLHSGRRIGFLIAVPIIILIAFINTYQNGGGGIVGLINPIITWAFIRKGWQADRPGNVAAAKVFLWICAAPTAVFGISLTMAALFADMEPAGVFAALLFLAACAGYFLMIFRHNGTVGTPLAAGATAAATILTAVAAGDDSGFFFVYLVFTAITVVFREGALPFREVAAQAVAASAEGQASADARAFAPQAAAPAYAGVPATVQPPDAPQPAASAPPRQLLAFVATDSPPPGGKEAAAELYYATVKRLGEISPACAALLAEDPPVRWGWTSCREAGPAVMQQAFLSWAVGQGLSVPSLDAELGRRLFLLAGEFSGPEGEAWTGWTVYLYFRQEGDGELRRESAPPAATGEAALRLRMAPPLPQLAPPAAASPQPAYAPAPQDFVHTTPPAQPPEPVSQGTPQAYPTAPQAAPRAEQVGPQAGHAGIQAEQAVSPEIQQAGYSAQPQVEPVATPAPQSIPQGAPPAQQAAVLAEPEIHQAVRDAAPQAIARGQDTAQTEPPVGQPAAEATPPTPRAAVEPQPGSGLEAPLPSAPRPIQPVPAVAQAAPQARQVIPPTAGVRQPGPQASHAPQWPQQAQRPAQQAIPPGQPMPGANPVYTQPGPPPKPGLSRNGRIALICTGCGVLLLLVIVAIFQLPGSGPSPTVAPAMAAAEDSAASAELPPAPGDEGSYAELAREVDREVVRTLSNHGDATLTIRWLLDSRDEKYSVDNFVDALTANSAADGDYEYSLYCPDIYEYSTPVLSGSGEQDRLSWLQAQADKQQVSYLRFTVQLALENGSPVVSASRSQLAISQIGSLIDGYFETAESDLDNDLTAQPFPSTGELTTKERGFMGTMIFEVEDNMAAYVQICRPDGTLVKSLFINAGHSLTTIVPEGEFIVRHANGSNWYGESDVFGRAGHYRQMEDDFSIDDDGDCYEISLVVGRNSDDILLDWEDMAGVD